MIAATHSETGEHKEFVGIAEISERTGMSRPALTNASRRRASSGFPEPVAVLAMGPVYDWSEVKAWHESKAVRP